MSPTFPPPRAHHRPNRPGPGPRPPGFTLVELLVVIAVVTVLLGLLLPTLARGKAQAQGVLCLSNARQLTLAWTLYAGDNEDRLVYNLVGDQRLGRPPEDLDLNWVNNVLSWELEAGNTNLEFIARSPLGPYVGRAVSLFTCPADHVVSRTQREAGWTGRVRSFSMNAMVGHPGLSLKGGGNVNNPGYRQFLKLSDFWQPSRIFVFLDEHPDSITDGYFLNVADELEWRHLPASYHNSAGNFSFADGHAESHRWLFARTRPPARPEAATLPGPVPPSESADFDWVQDRTSVERYVKTER